MEDVPAHTASHAVKSASQHTTVRALLEVPARLRQPLIQHTLKYQEYLFHEDVSNFLRAGKEGRTRVGFQPCPMIIMLQMFHASIIYRFRKNTIVTDVALFFHIDSTSRGKVITYS